jgi:hypothetical protein
MTANGKALAMWLEFMATSAWLPMPDKGKMFKLNLLLNSVTSAGTEAQ